MFRARELRGSLAAHLSMVSGWSASCSTGDATRCTPRHPRYRGSSDRRTRQARSTIRGRTSPISCTEPTSAGATTWPTAREPDCEDDADDLPARDQQRAGRLASGTRCRSSTPSTRRPVGNVADGRRSSTTPRSRERCRRCPGSCRERSASTRRPSISDGQAYVTSLINAVMQGPDWNSTAIFLDLGRLGRLLRPRRRRPSWTRTATGCGCRPWSSARTPGQGYIDHQTLSFDAYVKFIEDDFLGGQRLDPKTDGRPDPRPTVRENVANLGNLHERLRLHPDTASAHPPTAAPALQLAAGHLTLPGNNSFEGYRLAREHG